MVNDNVTHATTVGSDASHFMDDLQSLIPNLRAFAISLCGDMDRADDLVQDTLVRAWTNRQKFEIGTNLRAWLFTILRNAYFSSYRKRRREVEDVDGKRAAAIAVAPEQYACLELSDVHRALEQLAPDQREALVLIASSGMSYDEAAEICGCAVGTIKSRVNRARSRLCQILFAGDQEFGEESEFDGIVSAANQRLAS